MKTKIKMNNKVVAIALAAVLFASLSVIALNQQAHAQAITTRQLQLDKSQRTTGGVNAVNKFVFDSINKDSGSILFTTNGTSLSAEVAQIEVSMQPTSNFISVDNITLTSGQKYVGIQYSDSDRATKEDVNPFDFRYINITVPALGTGETSTVTVSAK